MEYVYEGPGPIETDGSVVRPGDVREFAEEPDWGPWRPLGGGPPESPETASEPPATQAPAPAPVSPGAASTPPPAPKQGE